MLREKYLLFQVFDIAKCIGLWYTWDPSFFTELLSVNDLSWMMRVSFNGESAAPDDGCEWVPFTFVLSQLGINFGTKGPKVQFEDTLVKETRAHTSTQASSAFGMHSSPLNIPICIESLLRYNLIQTCFWNMGRKRDKIFQAIKPSWD